MTGQPELAYLFGPFRLIPARRLLLEAEQPVRLGSRALEILIALAERPAQLLTKNELLARAWPSTHVVEGNLKFQIAAVRRALGDGSDGRRFIEASPGQGYRFVSEVTVEEGAQPRPAMAAPPGKHNVPA